MSTFWGLEFWVCVCEIFGFVAELWLHYDMSSLIYVDLYVFLIIILSSLLNSTSF